MNFNVFAVSQDSKELSVTAISPPHWLGLNDHFTMKIAFDQPVMCLKTLYCVKYISRSD